MAVEEERKFDVDPSFVLPELAGCLPPGGRQRRRAPKTLTATYYDTEDLRLARTGASLRYRVGDRQPWTVKLPSGTPGVRHEVSRDGGPESPPAELVALVTATTRAAPLRPVAVLRSRRHRLELHDAAGAVLAEIADDTVSVMDGEQVRQRFREIEVERREGGPQLLADVGAVLVAAGAGTAPASTFTPKYVRALGAAAAAPSDLPAPEPLPDKPRAADVVVRAIRRSVARLLAHDPLVRLGQPLPDGDTPVHQLRVACRRLRSDLRTFEALVDAGWAKRLRKELRWLARVLGAARDAEVLRARLWRTAADPLAPVDPVAVAHIDGELASRHADALAALAKALATDRYVTMLELLVDAARQPQLTALAQASAREVLPRLVTGPWHALAYGPTGLDGAGDLDPTAPDEVWHAVRVRGKQARYAVEAVAEAMGGEAPKLARRLAAVQDLLGEHQDAAIAATTWLKVSQAAPAEQPLAVAVGRLYERERAAIRRVRADFPEAWRAASRHRLVGWLP